MKKIHLVLIDPQNSFCKVVPQAEQQVLHDGELCVPGAWESMAVRVPNLVNRLVKKIRSITTTLDSHRSNHIAHAALYKDSKGNKPSPFTIMREEAGKIIGACFNQTSGSMVDVGEYFGVTPSIHRKIVEYLVQLRAGNKFPHCIWPNHCLIGTPGHNIVAPLFESLLNWSNENVRDVNYVTKGSNTWVEHFSAIKAEVEDPSDPTTQPNMDFIRSLEENDEILFAGEARSHCLNNTVRDIVKYSSGDDFVKKCVLLTDACDDVPSFESYGEAFLKDMTALGMKTSTTVDYLA